MKSTIQYLIDNNLHVDSGLHFTINDLKYMVSENHDVIIINEGRKNREETLTRSDVETRLVELYNFVKQCSGHKINIDDFDFERLYKDLDDMFEVKSIKDLV